MKKLIYLLLIISLLANVFLIYKFLISGNTVKLPNDERTGIVVSEENRDFVMFEMRTFLKGVQAIHEGIQEDDYVKIEKSAAISGREVETHVPPDLMSALPIEFKKLGLDTHDRFDKIAEMARNKVKKEVLNKELAGLLNNCTSCHASFKFVTN